MSFESDRFPALLKTQHSELKTPLQDDLINPNGRLSFAIEAARLLGSWSRGLAPYQWRPTHSPISGVASCWEVQDRHLQKLFRGGSRFLRHARSIRSCPAPR